MRPPREYEFDGPQTYRGWTFEFLYPGINSFSKGGYTFCFQPDHDVKGFVSLQLHSEAGESLDVPGMPSEIRYRAATHVWLVTEPWLAEVNKLLFPHEKMHCLTCHTLLTPDFRCETCGTQLTEDDFR